MTDDFLATEELRGLGLRAIGRDVRISRHAVILRPGSVSVGDRSRIDAFCVISAGGGVTIGRNVHVSAHGSLLGRGHIEIGDFASVSVRCALISSNDDYSGASMVNPTVPEGYRGAVDLPIRIGAHAALGAGSIILAGVTIGESAVVGAMTLVKGDVAPYAIVAGVPARVIGERRREHRALAQRLLTEERDPGST
jgi:galactoside O-acetyltransferase